MSGPIRAAAAAVVAAIVGAACGTGSRPTLIEASTTTSSTIAVQADEPTTTSTTSTTSGREPVAAPDGRRYPAIPDDPTEMAMELVIVERALRDGSTPPDQLADLGHRQQVLYRVLGRHPEWDPQVYAVVPADLVDDVTSHLGARRAFIELVSGEEPPENVPVWSIVEPAPAEDLLAYYREAEDATGIEWVYLAAINLVESAMGRIVGLSTAGARGPMQFIPSTWEEVGEGSIDDPHDSILAAARYLVRRGGPEDMEAALWGYNNADEYVTAVNHYADLLRRDERNFVGLYHWEVHYFAAIGDLWLPVGYRVEEAMPAIQYLERAPWSRPPATDSELSPGPSPGSLDS